MDRHGAEGLTHDAHAGDVIEMRVRQEDRRQVQALGAHPRDQRIRAFSRVDRHRVAGLATRQEERVLVERRGWERLEKHH